MTLLRSKRSAALALAMTAAAAVAAVAVANPVDTVLAKRTAHGRKAMAVVVADTVGYRHFSVRITASPNQRVKAGWARACSNGYPGPRDVKTFVAKTPVTRKVRDVDPMWQGWACKLEADATLTGRGHVTVQLIGDN
jgi:hypothetical protein